ncbi:MAG: hypothetical protein RLZ52_914 [Pseudomonadota bacterium]|jgi:hypothetical protein
MKNEWYLYILYGAAAGFAFYLADKYIFHFFIH